MSFHQTARAETQAAAVVQAADRYARALREHGYTGAVADLRNEFKAEVERLAMQRDFAVEVAGRLADG